MGWYMDEGAIRSQVWVEGSQSLTLCLCVFQFVHGPFHPIPFYISAALRWASFFHSVRLPWCFCIITGLMQWSQLAKQRANTDPLSLELLKPSPLLQQCRRLTQSLISLSSPQVNLWYLHFEVTWETSNLEPACIFIERKGTLQIERY